MISTKLEDLLVYCWPEKSNPNKLLQDGESDRHLTAGLGSAKGIAGTSRLVRKLSETLGIHTSGL